MDLSGLGKLGAIVAVLVIGIDLYSRWTGQNFGPVNLVGSGTGPNVLGQAITSSQAAQAQTAAAQQVQALPPVPTGSVPPPPPSGVVPPPAPGSSLYNDLFGTGSSSDSVIVT